MNRIVRFYFLVVLIVLAGPACGVGYILSSSYYQFELLALREPIVKARLRGTLTRSQLSALNTIQRAREYGSSSKFRISTRRLPPIGAGRCGMSLPVIPSGLGQNSGGFR